MLGGKLTRKKNNGNTKQFNALIKKISAGKEYALEEFFNLFGDLMYSAALTVIKSSHLAEEIVNEVLAKIWFTSKNLPKINKPISWLYTVVVNCAKNALRKEQVFTRIYDFNDQDKIYTDKNYERINDNDEFFYYINDLDEIEKQIMIFRFVEDMKLKSIASELKKPLNTVTSIYYRAIKKIKTKNFDDNAKK